jgi:hypothetical protein
VTDLTHPVSTVQLRLVTTGGDDDLQDDLRSLRDWLRDDERVGPYLPVELGADAPRAGQMGDLAQTLLAAIGVGLDAAAFVVAVLAWRRSRADRPTVVLVRVTDGEAVEIEDGPATEAEVRRLLDGR